MPSSRILIASNTLGSSAASVTFSSIPATYTDLVLKISCRTNYSSTVDGIFVEFNGSTATNYSDTVLRGFGSTGIGNTRDTGNGYILFRDSNVGNTATSNTFSNSEIYIPSYTVSQNKPSSYFGVQENNTTEAFLCVTAGLWQVTSAITSIKLTPQVGPNFLTGSTFWLYGLKNS